MSSIKVSAVSYTNTLPFLNGIQNSPVYQEIDLTVDYPSECARKVIADEVDMGIIPIAALLEVDKPFIITDYCIGSDGAVDSVFLFANKPIEKIESLKLDYQSKTSNGLARILIKNYWKKEVTLVDSGEADAFVLIGDRTFGLKQKEAYAYDLGYYWKEYTGLPFAYAVWVANKSLPEQFKKSFNEALHKGVNNIDEVISELPARDNFDLKYYLTQSLDYNLDDRKLKAIDLYLRLFKEL